MSKKLFKSTIQIVILVIAALLVWYAAALITDSELIVPQPHDVLKLTFELLGKGQTYLALLSTLLRAVIAFVISVAVALLLAICVGVWSKCKFYVEVVVGFLRALPTIAIILVTLILFNSSIVPVVVAFLVGFPIVYSVFANQLNRNAKLLDVCKVYNVTPTKKIQNVLFPLFCEELPSQCSDTLPLCIKVVVAGEVLSLPLQGIGKQMYVGKVNLDTANVIALTVLTLVVCFVISGIVALCSRLAHGRSKA